MDDALTIAGGTTTAVATDELFADAARLGGLEAAASGWLERAGVISRGLHELDLREPAARWDTTSPAWSVGAAIQRLRETRNTAGSLHAALLETAERYGATERQIESAWQFGSRIGAWMLGVATPFLILPAIGAVGAQLGAKHLGWTTPLESLIAEHRHLLSDPAFVRFVRAAGGSVDEYVAGLLRIPALVPLGERLGAPENASVLLGAAGVAGLIGLNHGRVLVDGPSTGTRVDVRVSDNGSLRPSRGGPVVGAPAGVGDLAARIPDASADAAQIRVERYGGPGDARWIVYVSGTVDFALAAGEQAFDLTSNVHGIADDAALDAMRPAGAESGAGERAVRAAMRELGVGTGDPLILVGHSGGGVIAASIAADPELNAVAALSLGGPVASAEVREGVTVLSVEHAEDLVPATGGPGHPSPDRISVSRSVLEPGRAYDAAFPAHELTRYRETAALIDRSEEQRLTAFTARIAEVAGDGPAETSLWIARRELSRDSTPAGR